MNILAVLMGTLRRCRPLAGNDHAAQSAPCIASRQRIHNCPSYYFSAPYDAVLMDVQMPGMDGLEATRRILALAPDLPIIGQTAHAMVEAKAQCLDAGRVDHLVKPLDSSSLVKTLLRHVTRPASA